MIRIGTSGYNHRDWIGSFYTADLGPARYLARYAEEFEVCELAGAVHRMPGPEEARRVLGEAGDRLLFTALAPRRLVASIVTALEAKEGSEPFVSVEGRSGRIGEAVPRWGGRRFSLPQVGAGFLSSEGKSDEIPGRDFSIRGEMGQLLVRLREGLLPYAEAGRFRGVVLPLPRSVPAVEQAFVAIARIAERLEGLGLLVEPRDPSWVGDTALGFLRGIGAGLVLADGPDAGGPSLGPDRGEPRPLPVRPLSPFAPVTAAVACVRFHGRDAENRWAGGAARRDYLYSWEELVSWLATLRALASRSRELLIVFNNPWRGRAIENARMMRRLVGDHADARRTRAYMAGGGASLRQGVGPDVFHAPHHKREVGDDDR